MTNDNDAGRQQDKPASASADADASMVLSRRKLLSGIGAGVGMGLAASGASLVSDKAQAQQVAEQLAWAKEGKAPYAGVRIFELSTQMAGRLAGQLFADQGAEVFLARSGPSGLDDTYFDRGKVVLPSGTLSDTSSADVIIVDGDAPVRRLPHQIVLRITAALPGDEVYGDLPADAHEDLLNALVGFYTDMSLTGPLLGNPVIYMPLPLCSVYAAVNGSAAVASCLFDRTRTGLGRDITASRIAGGLSAIAALNLRTGGLPPHLMPVEFTEIKAPEGMSPTELKSLLARAATDDKWRNWLETRFVPLGGGPYRSKDGKWFLVLTAGNRRLTESNMRSFGLFDEILKLGVVNVDPYDAANIKYRYNNLADMVAIRFDLNKQIADMIEPIIASRTAREWEQAMANAQPYPLPVTLVMTQQEWMRDDHARRSGLVTAVRGTDDFQFGRMIWLDSAQPYPDLAVGRRAATLPPRAKPAPTGTGRPVGRRPLEGVKVLDLGNVVASPSCQRMLEELGADVTLVLPNPPLHTPTIVVAWSCEMAQGKKSIIVDTKTKDGMEVFRRLVARSDVVSGNKLDDQLSRLGIDPIQLPVQNPSAILMQSTAMSGERNGPRARQRGYDPSAQSVVGITMRFGGPDAPSYNGVASAVDYLCGYVGAFATATALYVRETSGGGKGTRASTSLVAAAQLPQVTFQKGEPPASAVGQNATGPTPAQRWYKVADGHIFATAPRDVSAEVAGKTKIQAIAHLKQQGILAVPVQTVNEIGDIHKKRPTTTMNWQRTEKDGWWSEMMAPTWFVFDGKPFDRSAPASRMGADAREVLTGLGYSPTEIDRLVKIGAIGRTEWVKA
jgi:crotonobetainyl-CoA:carnitine CoA-transferase CaiB-like acyl-CoA transferase